MGQKVDTYCDTIFTTRLLVYERKTKLHRIKIYYDTPTFQLITKDEKANFEEKLAAIGGTMGLLTGFSIISGVEIIYFGVKIAFRFIKKDKTTIV